MRIITALAGATLVVGVATAVAAQTAPVQTNPNTKVYAYKQTTPKAKSPSMNAKQQKPFEHIPDSVPYGSEKWWEVMGRSTGGGEGGAP
jgi:hypothetical protein